MRAWSVTQRLRIFESTLENLVRARKFPLCLKLDKNIDYPEYCVETASSDRRNSPPVDTLSARMHRAGLIRAPVCECPPC